MASLACGSILVSWQTVTVIHKEVGKAVLSCELVNNDFSLRLGMLVVNLAAHWWPITTAQPLNIALFGPGDHLGT